MKKSMLPAVVPGNMAGIGTLLLLIGVYKIGRAIDADEPVRVGMFLFGLWVLFCAGLLYFTVIWGRRRYEQLDIPDPVHIHGTTSGTNTWKWPKGLTMLVDVDKQPCYHVVFDHDRLPELPSFRVYDLSGELVAQLLVEPSASWLKATILSATAGVEPFKIKDDWHGGVRYNITVGPRQFVLEGDGLPAMLLGQKARITGTWTYLDSQLPGALLREYPAHMIYTLVVFCWWSTNIAEMNSGAS